MPPVDPGENAIHGLVGQVARARREGRSVLGLHVGDPEFPTPKGIREAASRALAAGATHYGPSQGLPSLRRAVAERWAAPHAIPADVDRVVVLPAKFAIFAALLATIDPGDEVLFADPSYFFEGPIRLAGGRPVRVPLRDDHSLDLDALAEALGPNARALLLVTPGNPTGRLLKRDELRAVGEIAQHRKVTLVSDETYSELVFEGRHVALAGVTPSDVPVVTIGSFSKTYSMTGWRAGFAIAPPEIAARLVRVVEHTITCVPPFVQEGCLWALEHEAPEVERLRGALRERRDVLLGALDDLPGVSYVHPDGAIYVFPRYDVGLGSAEVARLLLEEEGVAVAPGIAFGPRGERHLRLAFTLPVQELEEAARRLGEFLERHGAARG